MILSVCKWMLCVCFVCVCYMMCVTYIYIHIPYVVCACYMCLHICRGGVYMFGDGCVGLYMCVFVGGCVVCVGGCVLVCE